MRRILRAQLINYLVDCIGYSLSDLIGSDVETLIFLIGDNMPECIKYNS